MIRFIILSFSIAILFSFTRQEETGTEILAGQWGLQDTVPVKVDETLIRELSQKPQAKTWRDSGYYFQFENILWQAIRLGTTQNGDGIILASFSSADPSSLQFQGQAVFRFDTKDFPQNVTPSRGMQGEAVVAFPQDVLFCPSPSQEVGLGQNDPFFPLYLSGALTGIKIAGGEYLNFEALMSVQLRDIEIIL